MRERPQSLTPTYIPGPHPPNDHSRTQNNLIRCFLGAAVISVINIILDAVKPGWTYVILAGLCIGVSPLLFVGWGPVWRERRRKRMALRELQ